MQCHASGQIQRAGTIGANDNSMEIMAQVRVTERCPQMEVSAYIKFMEDYCDCYEALNALEQEKLDVVTNRRLHLLEGIVKKEEAAVLQARGLEVKRQEMQKKIGAEGKTMQEIIDSLEGAEQYALRQVQIRLTNQVKVMQGTNRVCSQLIRDQLKDIDYKIQEVSKRVEEKKKNDPLVNRFI